MPTERSADGVWHSGIKLPVCCRSANHPSNALLNIERVRVLLSASLQVRLFCRPMIASTVPSLQLWSDINLKLELWIGWIERFKMIYNICNLRRLSIFSGDKKKRPICSPHPWLLRGSCRGCIFYAIPAPLTLKISAKWLSLKANLNWLYFKSTWKKSGVEELKKKYPEILTNFWHKTSFCQTRNFAVNTGYILKCMSYCSTWLMVNHLYLTPVSLLFCNLIRITAACVISHHPVLHGPWLQSRSYGDFGSCLKKFRPALGSTLHTFVDFRRTFSRWPLSVWGIFQCLPQ